MLPAVAQSHDRGEGAPGCSDGSSEWCELPADNGLLAAVRESGLVQPPQPTVTPLLPTEQHPGICRCFLAGNLLICRLK